MPQLPQPGVAPRGLGTPYQTDRTYDASGAIQRGWQGLAQDVSASGREFGAAVNEYEARQERAKQKADTVKVNNSLTELDREGTDALYGTANPSPAQAADAAFDGMDVSKGYLASKGLTAQEISKGTYDRIEKKAKELRETLDDQQKAIFDAQSTRLLQQYYERIEGHAAAQRTQAELDSLKAAEAEALRKAALNPADDESARMSIGRIVGAQDQFTTSTEDAFAKAEEVQGKVTAARLEALLAQPGGFTDAERVLGDNKGAIARMGKLDEYSKRIEHAKLGGRAAVEADRIVSKAAGPDPGGGYSFRMPSGDLLEHELAEIAKKDPALFDKVAPIARAQLALKKEAVRQAKEEFIDFAKARYNKNHATFFSSDLADRLNKVDPDAYRVLWKETYQRAKAAGDGSPQGKRAQKDRDDLALLRYKSYGDGDINARLSLNPDTFVAGMNVSETGLERIRQAHAADQATRNRGLEQSQSDFVARTRAQLQAFAPDPGTTKQSRAAAREWWAEKTAEAVNAYTDWANNNPTKKAPSREEADALRARVIIDQPVRPDRPKSLEENAAAVRELAAPKKAAAGLVTVIGPKGQKGKAPAEGLDAWLAAHPDWKRQ